MRVAPTAASAAAALVVAAVAAAGGPAPLRGSPLRAKTGLRLVVAAKPPIVVDVDSGRVTRLRSIAVPGRGPLTVTAVGGRAAVAVAYERTQQARLWSVTGRVTPLGRGADVLTAADGGSVWVKRGGRASCSLRHVALDGRDLLERAIPCRATPTTATAAGLVVNRVRLIEPRSGRTLLRTRWGVLGAAGTRLLLAGPRDTFTVHDVATGAERRIRRPASIGTLDVESVDPRGRYLTLSAGDPAWHGGGAQVLDLWVLDTKTTRLTRVPGLPAFVALKLTSTAWTDDDRLVLLAQVDGRDVVGVWRPGQRRLALKTLKLPPRASAGSDTFAVVR
jgi:hypothetical protein